MQKKQKVDLVIAIFLSLIGISLTLLPNFKILDLETILFVVMMCYATLNLIQFVLTKESKDYEGLYTSILSYGIGVAGLYFNLFNGKIEMVTIILGWIILMSMIKFKKCDYYHDLNNRMWIIRIVTLLLFIVTGLLASINLYYSNDVQILILGFFFFIHGILEMIDPLAIYLMENR